MATGTRLLVLGLAAACAAGTALVVAASRPRGNPVSPGLVVHEWGTFTSVQGTDGVGLEGLHHEEESLPPFVYDRAAIRRCPLRDRGHKGLEVPVEHATQKMETPVVYFHTATPRRVRFRVDLVDGLLTQWYPVVDRLGPPEGAAGDGPLDLTGVKRSFLEWDLDLVPRSAGAPGRIPEVDAGDPWAFAREVDSAFVRTRPREGAGRSGPVEAEHYLFYRGLGAFSIPLTVRFREDGTAVLRNGTGGRIPAAFALWMGPRGEAGLRTFHDIGPGEEREFAPEAPAGVLREEVVEALEGKVRAALEGEGLFADEARAMVRTWSRQWFRSEGTRVIWLVPRETTNRILPATVTPAPDRFVRVLVGRLEYLTPSTEREVETALRARTGADPSARNAAEARLARLGRFLEPHVRRVRAATADAQVRASADEVLAGLR